MLDKQERKNAKHTDTLVSKTAEMIIIINIIIIAAPAEPARVAAVSVGWEDQQ